MREIKFDFIYKGAHRFHHKQYYLEDLIGKSLANLSDLHHQMELIASRQFTGLHDKNGKEIYEGDLLNVFFTSENQEYNHDCIYEVVFDKLELRLVYRRLLWESFGYNQYTVCTNLNPSYGTLELGPNHTLKMPSRTGRNHLRDHSWQMEDGTDYFCLIGNIYEHQHLLE